MNNRKRFDAACESLLQRMIPARVLFAKKYGRGELDALFNFSPSIHSKIPNALKQELYAVRRRWRVHQFYKDSNSKKFLPNPQHLTPSLKPDGAGQA